VQAIDGVPQRKGPDMTVGHGMVKALAHNHTKQNPKKKNTKTRNVVIANHMTRGSTTCPRRQRKFNPYDEPYQGKRGVRSKLGREWWGGELSEPSKMGPQSSYGKKGGGVPPGTLYNNSTKRRNQPEKRRKAREKGDRYVLGVRKGEAEGQIYRVSPF